MLKVDCDFISDLLIISSKYDMMEELYWTTDLQFYINCNDVFLWGSADAEDVTLKSLNVLEQSYIDAEFDGAYLYCARQRKIRPQGALYSSINKKHWDLFNACGPEREISLGNPYKPGEYKS